MTCCSGRTCIASTTCGQTMGGCPNGVGAVYVYMGISIQFKPGLSYRCSQNSKIRIRHSQMTQGNIIWFSIFINSIGSPIFFSIRFHIGLGTSKIYWGLTLAELDNYRQLSEGRVECCRKDNIYGISL